MNVRLFKLFPRGGKTHLAFPRRVAVALWLLLGVLSAGGLGQEASAGEDDGGVWWLEFANEDRSVLEGPSNAIFDPLSRSDGSDGNFTWAWRVSFTPYKTNPKWADKVRDYLPWLSDEGTVRVSYGLEQDFFTPDSKSLNEGRLVRPHAGYLRAEPRIAILEDTSGKSQRIEFFDLSVGVVGAASGSEAVHRGVHNLIGKKARQWNQIGNEPVLNLYYERAQRLFLFDPDTVVNVELMPHAGVALGNLLTYGALGGSVRIGSNLDKDAGPSRTRPFLAGAHFAERGDYFAWNLFLGLEGRAVARNMLLDGNSFRDSPSVDKNNLVYDAQVGFELGYGVYRLSAVSVFRSREFKKQPVPDQFIRLGVSFGF